MSIKLSSHNKEIGLNERALIIISAFGFFQVVENSQSSDLSLKICVYSDFRVAPHSIASLQERLAESYERNKNNPKMIQSDPEKFKQASDAMQHIEDEIFKKRKLKPEDINDQSISSTVEDLKNGKYDHRGKLFHPRGGTIDKCV